jgi:hypothetical protein
MNDQGIIMLRRNVFHMDVSTDIPAMCENQRLSYIFIPTNEPINAYATRP